MGFRANKDTQRPAALTFNFDGASVTAYPGETIAAALIASNVSVFRRDTRGAPRGPYCNMGTCFDCLVEVRIAADANHSAHASWREVRACLATVASDLEVRPAVSAQALVDPS
jgi:sarcosine oxidase subunit alpha